MVETAVSPSAPKRPKTISLSPDICDKANHLGINLSQSCDQLLRDVIRQEKAKRWTAENAKLIGAYTRTPGWGFCQRDKALKGMHYFDAILQKQLFVAGDAFSMADITVIGGLIFARLVKLPIPAQCEALETWHAGRQERLSLKNRLTISEANESSV